MPMVLLPVSLKKRVFLKVITHKAGHNQTRKPQRELVGTMSFGKSVSQVGEVPGSFVGLQDS